MSAKLSVIFYIILCLEIGIMLTVLPWIPQGTLGLSDWGNNFFLLYAARQTGAAGLYAVVASGWVRGAVTGVGALNLGIAFWEMFHFKDTVRSLQKSISAGATRNDEAPRPVRSNHLPDFERQNDSGDDQHE
jgi:hypothetical protein